MIRKSAQYEESCRLRKRGFTYTEIAHVVGVSKSTVSIWLSHETWSISVTNDNKKRTSKENGKRIGLLNKARSNQLKKQYAEAERSATISFKHYKHFPAFIAGIMLYAALGDCSLSNQIRISTSRKSAHRIFITFMQEYLGVPRENIRFWLLLYPTHSPEKVSRIWSRSIRVPITQFHRYQVLEKQNTIQTLHDGVGNTIIGNTILKRTLLKWVTLAEKEY
ncbi:helix-turn-helix domain-containing protein [Candidatus Kaiserbacteria bacterium]|nr:MAG: helix-turn-helix domain-containing protein [Candidatus Kaiserbacteria bacterium]